jgi:putative ABC transport system ATP-binding protein
VPVISVRDIVKTYTVGEVTVRALRGADLDIEKGEFVAITGPSGSGKSTLMHILGCLDRPTSGTYFLDGVDVSRMSKDELAMVRNKKIGFVFQGFNLLSRTTALDNVELPLLYNGGSKMKSAERRRRAMDALKIVGLGERFHHFPNQLSAVSSSASRSHARSSPSRRSSSRTSRRAISIRARASRSWTSSSGSIRSGGSRSC